MHKNSTSPLLRRRSLLAAGAGGLGLLVWRSAQAQPPGYTVSAAQLQQAVAQRFPLRYPLAGLLNIDVQGPTLRLLPAQNRLAAQMAVLAAGPALRHSYNGNFDVDFALRYEPTDLTIRAQALRVQRLVFDALPEGAAELIGGYGPPLAEQALQDVVLHQLRPQDLALPDGLGLQPGSISVTAQGLAVAFVPKPL